MKIESLIEIIKKLPRPAGTKFYPAAPLIHPGFPNCFNLSFAEYEVLREFNDQYLHYDHDLIYSKVQPCVRHQDWETIVVDEDNRYRYLSLFNMADISSLIIYREPERQEEVAKLVIKSFIDFIKQIGLDISKLNISYFLETSIKEATNGKYNFEYLMPTDPMLYYWKELGIKDSQLTPDKTRDTLLALRIFGKQTPWGYRNEVHYEYKGKLLDIGTVEFMRYEPLFDKNNDIYNLKKYGHSVGIGAIGLERVNMVLNNLENVWEVDTIKPLIDLIIEKSFTHDKIQAMIVAQALRTIHSIVADGGVYKKLNHKRKENIRVFYRALILGWKKLGIELNRANLKEQLNLNSKLQKNKLLIIAEDIVVDEILARVETIGE